jgi:cation/acetate symporter
VVGGVSPDNQMVEGQQSKLLFGPEYWIAVVIVGALIGLCVLFGSMTTTKVQIIKGLPAARRSIRFVTRRWHFGTSRGHVATARLQIKTNSA